MKRNNILCLQQQWAHFSSHQLCSVLSPSKGLVLLKQLIIHDSKLILSNAQHEFLLKLDTIVFMTSTSLGYSNDPFVITGGYTIPKALAFKPASQGFQCSKSELYFLGFNSYGTKFP
ncbi:hypothetical protein TNCV_2251811 [Trichonephila clavipes]|nr:hypothetical protein TNCV_2251811 [Trichonephila clavipes]